LVSALGFGAHFAFIFNQEEAVLDCAAEGWMTRKEFIPKARNASGSKQNGKSGQQVSAGVWVRKVAYPVRRRGGIVNGMLFAG